MSVSGVTPLSSKFRLAGLATGLDTDQIVSDLIKAERIPLDKLMQKKQLTEWKRDEYRGITNLLRGLKDDYFNLLKPSSNMLSKTNYKKFTSISSDSNIVTVSGTADAAAGAHTIRVTALATADKASSTSGVTESLSGTVGSFSLSGKKFNITLDGVQKEIQLNNYTNLDELVDPNTDTSLQGLINKAFGTGKILVSNVSGKLQFTTIGGASKLTLSSAATNNALGDLGFTSGASNRISKGATLDALSTRFTTDLQFDSQGKLKFSINSSDEFVFDKSVTLASMMDTINNDEKAGVNITYDEVTDKFSITAKQLGAGNNIRLQQSGGTFFDGASGIILANPVNSEGTDASAVIDSNINVTRSSNSFTVNGITYNLHNVNDPNNADDKETIEITQDVDGIYDNIKSFVDKYNEVIAKINGELAEKYDREYQPLTQEQKDGMSENDIEKWEEKAKTGLLRNDSLLQNVVYSMRKALSDPIQGLDINLSNIGIKTGTYEERGKLIIDDIKLKEAIQKNPDGIMKLFSKESGVNTNIDLDSEKRSIRYNGEGFAYRLFDIVEDNIRTFRDKNNKKGLLLEKAGMSGDVSEFTNLLYGEIEDYNTRIQELNDKLYDKETSYYNKFAALEEAISKMNSQSSWLTSQFNQGS